MTQRMLDAAGGVAGYLLIAMAVFPAAAIRIGMQITDDLCVRLDNRKKTT